MAHMSHDLAERLGHKAGRDAAYQLHAPGHVITEWASESMLTMQPLELS
jgi:hypothetical protein